MEIKTASYRIIESFSEVEYYIRTQPLSKSALDLADEIAKEFNVEVSPQTIRNYRKKLPSSKIKYLREERAQNIESLRFVIELLKEGLENIDNDIGMKLRYAQEITSCIKEINSIINEEIEYLKNLKSF